jgi:thiol-disulfide isomerase/thioredoxin
MEEPMSTRKNLFAVIAILAMLVSACSAAAQTPEAMKDKPATDVMMEKTEEPMMDKPTETAMMDKPTEEGMMEKTEDPMMDKSTPTPDAMMDKSTPEAAMEDKSAMMDAPAWFGATFTDARTGETFTIDDFKGKVVLVETLAMWCPNCLKQQMQVLELHKLLGERDDFVSFGLDIDINENAVDLKAYVEKNGFTWRYAVATAEVAREIGQLYGDQFLNPPSTPMLIIDRQGQVHPLPFGIKSSDDLMKALEPFLKEGM